MTKKTTNYLLTIGALYLGWQFFKPKNESVGAGKKINEEMYELLTNLPFSTYGYREAEVLRKAESIKKVQKGIWKVEDDRGNYFEITYGHPHTKDFTIVG